MKVLIGLPFFENWMIAIKNNQKEYNSIYSNSHLEIDNIELFFDKMDNITSLINYINHKKIQILIPLTFEQMNFIACNYDILKNIINKIICDSDFNKITMLNNKCLFAQFMMSNDLSIYIPQTYIINNNDDRKSWDSGSNVTSTTRSRTAKPSR